MIHTSDVKIYEPYLRVVDFALDQLEDRIKSVIMLDAGCGHSTVLEEQYKRCYQVIGVDKDRVGLNRNNLVDRKIFTDLTQIPLPDYSVDLLTSAWVLEHIESPDEFSKEIKRLIRPGGYFAFIAPNKDSWYAIISSQLPHKWHQKVAKKFYGRDIEDTFDTFYRMNSEEEIDSLLDVGKSFNKIDFIYNDDPKYLSINSITKPFAKAWHHIVMTKPLRQDRLHLIGLYKRLPEVRKKEPKQVATSY